MIHTQNFVVRIRSPAHCKPRVLDSLLFRLLLAVCDTRTLWGAINYKT